MKFYRKSQLMSYFRENNMTYFQNKLQQITSQMDLIPCEQIDVWYRNTPQGLTKLRARCKFVHAVA